MRYSTLFADAEIFEHVCKYLVAWDSSHNLGEVAYAGTQVQTHQVAGYAVEQALLDVEYVCQGFFQCFVVAHVGDYHVALRDGGECSAAHKEFLQPVEVAP